MRNWIIGTSSSIAGLAVSLSQVEQIERVVAVALAIIISGITLVRMLRGKK